MAGIGARNSRKNINRNLLRYLYVYRMGTADANQVLRHGRCCLGCAHFPPSLLPTTMMQHGWDSARSLFERLPPDTPRGTALCGAGGRALHFTGKRNPFVLRFHSFGPGGDALYWPQRAGEEPQEAPRAATFSIRVTAPPRAINHARFSATHRVVNDRWVPKDVRVEQAGARKGKAFIRGKWRQPGTSASGHYTDYPPELLEMEKRGGGSKRARPQPRAVGQAAAVQGAAEDPPADDTMAVEDAALEFPENVFAEPEPEPEPPAWLGGEPCMEDAEGLLRFLDGLLS